MVIINYIAYKVMSAIEKRVKFKGNWRYCVGWAGYGSKTPAKRRGRATWSIMQVQGQAGVNLSNSLPTQSQITWAPRRYYTQDLEGRNKEAALVLILRAVQAGYLGLS
jgi:hypothetical protein